MSSRVLLVLPILIPLLTGVAALLLQRAPRIQRAVSIFGAAALLVSGIALLSQAWSGDILVTQVGNWPAPFGITFVADILSAIMVVLAGMTGLATVVYSLWGIDRRREAFGFHPLIHVLLMGVCGSFLTGDIFNLYVWFEVMLISSFVLMALGGERAQMDGAIKYVVINLVSSAFFLGAIGILYRLTGTLNFADLSRVIASVAADPEGLTTGVSNGAVVTTSMLFLVAFGIKAAVFPLFFWLPASYHTPPVVVSAIFAGLLTKVGVYALIRVFTLVFVTDPGFTHSLILVIAGLTMITGVLGAMSQSDVRSILSFHIVSQIGYMIMGLGLFTPLALAGSVFYILHHIIVKTNLFFVAGIMQRLGRSSDLARLGGLYDQRPLLSVLFLVPAMSLAGLPPLSGFFAKLALVKAGLELQSYVIVAVALAVSLLTLYSMTKIWIGAFWKPAPVLADDAKETGDPGTASDARPNVNGLMVPVAAMAMVTVVIGLAAGPLFDLASRSSEQLLDSSTYVQAVLDDRQQP